MLAAFAELLISSDTIRAMAEASEPLQGRDAALAIQVLLVVGLALLGARTQREEQR